MKGKGAPETATDLNYLPDGLPVPQDDGAAGHLVGLQWPDVSLPATNGQSIDLAQAAGRTIVYAYPRNSQPGDPPDPATWDLIPGARGCTPQACDFRDHHAELREAGAHVYGLSTQSTAYQQEAVQRLHLPFAMLSDEDQRLTQALRLPTFEFNGEVLLRRLTLVVADGVVEHCWYPVFPPNAHAAQVVTWLRTNRP